MDDFKYLHQSLGSEGSDIESFGLRPAIYLVEDDVVLGESIKKYLLKTLQCDIYYFLNSFDCLEAILQRQNIETPFCLITDISLDNGHDGLILIDTLKDKSLNFVSIAITGFASIENAISATKKGVFHYLTKPFELENLKSVVIDAITQKLGSTFNYQDVSKKSYKTEKIIDSAFCIEMPTEDDVFCGMIGRSKVMRDLFERIKKVALTDSTVLITGPSGTGKELVATAIHRLSLRSKASIVSVNCGAIPSDLLESELFGHVKGSFTGAISNRKGRFEMANKGTIFLDEIGDMPQLLQVKILRVLQSKSFEPVGSNETHQIDTRVIAATHRHLEKMVGDGNFREDLFYRLNVIPLKVPALKDRREDIPLLIAYFVNKFVSANKSNQISFSADALDMLMAHDWPGNVRELENIIERLVILRGGHEITPEDLPSKIMSIKPMAVGLDNFKYMFELPEDGLDLKQVLSEIEDSLITQALSYTNGNKNQASKLLNLNRTTLIEKLKKKSLEA